MIKLTKKTKINIAIASAVAIASYFVISSANSSSNGESDSPDLVQYNLDQLNAYRAIKGIAPLVHDPVISNFALAGSHLLSSDHRPHAHFIKYVKESNVFGSMSAENQGDPNGVSPMEGKRQIDIMLKMMFDEGPGGGHYENMMNPNYKKVGIGLWSTDGRLYMTNDFSN